MVFLTPLMLVSGCCSQLPICSCHSFSQCQVSLPSSTGTTRVELLQCRKVPFLIMKPQLFILNLENSLNLSALPGQDAISFAPPSEHSPQVPVSLEGTSTGGNNLALRQEGWVVAEHTLARHVLAASLTLQQSWSPAFVLASLLNKNSNTHGSFWGFIGVRGG